MRRGLAWAGIALVAVAGGCTSKPAVPSSSGTWSAAASAPPFVEPAAYSYVLVRGCDAAAPLGRYRATVRDGAVVESERLDRAGSGASGAPAVDLGPIGGQDGEEIEVPTLGQLLEFARTAADDGGAVTTTYDPADGHPLRVTIDVESLECFAVTDYRR